MILSKNYNAKERRDLLFSKGARICFLGIGGVSMHALAHFCLFRGVYVFGADKTESAYTRRLEDLGVRVFIPEAGAAIESASAVVCSLAMDEGNGDVMRARAKNIPILTRGELLGALMEEYTLSVAVSGTHGKSTVTAMLASVLCGAARDPSVLCGAALSGGGQCFRMGGKELLVAEACEYGDSFLSLRPSVSLLLNLEADHPDYFRTEDALTRSFARFAMGSGTVFYSANCERLRALIEHYGIQNALSVGPSAACDYRYEIEAMEKGYATVRFFDGKNAPMSVKLSVPGRFQAENAAMALAAASYLGIAPSVAGAALSRFGGIDRRICRIGAYEKIPLYYDYAHHPTQIRATVEALRQMHGAKVTVLFRPHTFSRTQALFSAFVSALSEADRVLITDIDGAREQGGAVSAEDLASAVGGTYVPLAQAAQMLCEVHEGCAVIMGAGELQTVLSRFLGTAEKNG
jgi:UDP-N-acetylmuramate--alanine ligase